MSDTAMIRFRRQMIDAARVFEQGGPPLGLTRRSPTPNYAPRNGSFRSTRTGTSSEHSAENPSPREARAGRWVGRALRGPLTGPGVRAKRSLRRTSSRPTCAISSRRSAKRAGRSISRSARRSAPRPARSRSPSTSAGATTSTTRFGIRPSTSGVAFIAQLVQEVKAGQPASSDIMFTAYDGQANPYIQRVDWKKYAGDLPPDEVMFDGARGQGHDDGQLVRVQHQARAARPSPDVVCRPVEAAVEGQDRELALPGLVSELHRPAQRVRASGDARLRHQVRDAARRPHDLHRGRPRRRRRVRDVRARLRRSRGAFARAQGRADGAPCIRRKGRRSATSRRRFPNTAAHPNAARLFIALLADPRGPGHVVEQSSARTATSCPVRTWAACWPTCAGAA